MLFELHIWIQNYSSMTIEVKNTNVLEHINKKPKTKNKNFIFGKSGWNDMVSFK